MGEGGWPSEWVSRQGGSIYDGDDDEAEEKFCTAQGESGDDRGDAVQFVGA